MVKRGIKTEDQLLSLAWARTKDGEPHLQSFVLNKTPKAQAGHIATTWRCRVQVSCWSGHARPEYKLYLRH